MSYPDPSDYGTAWSRVKIITPTLVVCALSGVVFSIVAGLVVKWLGI